MKNIIISLFTIVALSAGAQEKYPYPMDIPVSISASFAELRANHFHAGLDMSTQGVIGCKVRSVADGYVSRIKISPYGYGHALYIDHPDGHTTVYAHLSAYADKIDSVATAEQYKKKSFDIDLMLKPGQIRVKKGEVIALSGNSGGSGGPHLHFEVRDTKTELALNPLSFLLPIADTQAPTVYGVKIYGMTDDAQVAGACRDRYYQLSAIEGKTINVIGQIGLGMHAVDYFVAGHRPCGVTEIRLYDGEQLMFRSVLDSISFDDTRYINSHIDYAERAENKRFVQKSFVDANNRLPVYRTHKEIIVRQGETHQMHYELYDHNGNKRMVSFTLRGVASDNVAFKKHNGAHVEWGRTWTADTLGISVLIPREALYHDEYVEIVKTDLNNDISIYRIGDKGIASHKNITISLPLSADMTAMGNKVFVAQVGDKGQKTYTASSVEGNMVSARVKSLGSFAVSCDTIAPKVWSKNSRNNLKAGNSIMVGLSDDMSGIKKYNVYIDGQWKCFDYDYKNARLIAQVSRLRLTEGNHRLVAKIEDECGNLTQFEWTFVVVK